MSHSPAISVIVPVYKTERYLQECIDSILAQSFPDFELILVDDGSPDRCGEICDLNAARDKRIRVIHQLNQGVNRARANGVAAAKGEFISFVDSDDILPQHSLAVLYEPIDEHIDITHGKYEGGYGLPIGKIDKKEYTKLSAMMGFHMGPCAKLFRKSLFDKKIFEIPRHLKIGEDTIMNIRLAYKVKGHIYSTNKEVYVYRMNKHSITHKSAHTPQSAMLLQKLQLSSIPSNDVEQFLPCGLANNLIQFWMSASSHIKKLPSSTSKHHRFLWSIKNHSTLKMGLYSNILFHCRNSFVRTLVISLKKVCCRQN